MCAVVVLQVTDGKQPVPAKKKKDKDEGGHALLAEGGEEEEEVELPLKWSSSIAFDTVKVSSAESIPAFNLKVPYLMIKDIDKAHARDMPQIVPGV